MFLFDTYFDLNGEKLEALVIFSGQCEGSAEEYGFLFESKLRSANPRPRIVVFIYPEYLNEYIGDMSVPGSEFYDNIIRFGEDTPVLICSFNGFGELNLVNNIFLGNEVSDVGDFGATVVQDGVLHLANKRKDAVILKSPPGTVFVKPSKKQLGEFIQASGLTVGYSENQFVAFSLLRFRPRNINLRNIYIDTSGISAFVEALTYYLHKFSSETCKPVKYHSFKSYFGLNDQKPDDTDDIWVIISASNSNSLGRKIAQEWGLIDEQSVTVLSFSNKSKDGIGDSIVCNISSISDGYKDPDKFSPTIGVKVVGENFTAQVCEPNQVIIKEIHKAPEISKFIEQYNSSDIFRCLKYASADKKVRPIYIDALEVINNDSSLNNWLNNIISWYTPSTLKWVIYDNSREASCKLVELIKANLDNSEDLIHLSFKDAEKEITGGGALLVIDPVISNGKSLLRLNRNLRISGHNGNRIFICPIVTASSKAAFKNFKNGLTFGPNSLKYQFFSFYEAFVGHITTDNSWTMERKVVENLRSELWRHREHILSLEGEGLNGNVGTPGLRKDAKLSFTKDFAFWRNDYIPENINPEAVYLTVSAILQRLREKPFSEDDKDSLVSHVYQHSVIDPENFSRFNDSLIQSCLWRAANATEVDYKSSEELSESFSALLLRLVEDLSNGIENSALDLLMGLAVGKIAVTKNVLVNIVAESKDKLVDVEHAIELLKYIENEYLD